MMSGTDILVFMYIQIEKVRKEQPDSANAIAPRFLTTRPTGSGRVVRIRLSGNLDAELSEPFDIAMLSDLEEAGRIEIKDVGLAQRYDPRIRLTEHGRYLARMAARFKSNYHYDAATRDESWT